MTIYRSAAVVGLVLSMCSGSLARDTPRTLLRERSDAGSARELLQDGCPETDPDCQPVLLPTVCGTTDTRPCPFEPPCVCGLALLLPDNVCVLDPDALADCDVIDQSVQPCGHAGEPACETGEPCLGRSALTLDNMCVPCGADGLAPCPNGTPCDARTILVDEAVCVTCGGLDDVACDDRPACDGGLWQTLEDSGNSTGCTDFYSEDSCGFAAAPLCAGAEPCRDGFRASVFGFFCEPCGRAGEPPCTTLPACEPGLTIIAPTVFKRATCEPTDVDAPDVVIDQNVPNCGAAGQTLCTGGGPLCFGRTLPDEDGTCRKCGGDGGLPCRTAPDCNDGLVLAPGASFCAPCGVKNAPPCPGDAPCAAGLMPVSSGDGLGEFCATPAPVGTCGSAGEPLCAVGAACRGRSVPALDGESCVACGSTGQPVCTSGQPCNAGFSAVVDAAGVAIACQESGVLDQNLNDVADGPATVCGYTGQAQCATGGAKCFARNVPADDGTCVSCGDAGEAPCADFFPCDDRLVLAGSACAPCGAAGQPVCDLGEACDAGLAAVDGSCA